MNDRRRTETPRNREAGCAEVVLTVLSKDADTAVRPLPAGAFVSELMTVAPASGSGWKMSAQVANLGTKPVYAAVAEFVGFSKSVVPIGASTRQLLAMTLLPTIGPGQPTPIAVTVDEHSMANVRDDIFMVQAYQPAIDPIGASCDAINDRHVGQVGYPFAGTWIGDATAAGATGAAHFNVVIGRGKAGADGYTVHMDSSGPVRAGYAFDPNPKCSGGTLVFQQQTPLVRPPDLSNPPTSLGQQRDGTRRLPPLVQPAPVLISEFTLVMLDNNTMRLSDAAGSWQNVQLNRKA